MSAPSTHRAPRRQRYALQAAALATVAALFGAGGFAYSHTSETPTVADSGSSQAVFDRNPTQSQVEGSTPATDATAKQESGLVYINTTLGYGAGAGAGTGMILTSDGEILTNNHVVEGATSISVQVISTGTRYDATVVGTDATNDVAVLQLENASGLDTVTTDTESTVAVGDKVTGVGNAGGDGGAASAAAGTVLAVDQSITVQSESGGAPENLTGLIEVDADILAGDSGGPLYDDQGEVIGMNTAASSGSVDVTGYAIPIATALDIAGNITDGTGSDTVTLGNPAFLGVQLADDSTTIAGVVDGSPAAGAGLKAGDTVISLGGTNVTTGTDLSAAITSYAAGDSVSVTWTDTTGQIFSATVQLDEGPST
ncbi:hypothetical protein BH09ACT10_BH09ACT10_20570 [soil metagenome]